MESGNQSEMEEIPLSEAFKKSLTVKRKGTAEENSAIQLNASPSERSGSRRTRSQIAPDWSIQDTLTLVNEKIAVERECGDAVSSFQKWTYVSENLTAMDVVRNVNQCRRKWDSLLEEYKVIKGWGRKSKSSGYWLLDIQGRKRVGLPLDFDQEVYGAIDDFMKTQQDHSGTDPDTDTDPETIAEMLFAKRSGSKKPLNRPIHHGVPMKEEESLLVMTKSSKKSRSTPHIGVVENQHMQIEQMKCASTEAQTAKKPAHQPALRRNNMKANERMLTEDGGWLLTEANFSKKPRHRSTACKGKQEENGDLLTEERKQVLAGRLWENTKLINAIVAGNVYQEGECDKSGDLKNLEALEMRKARHKAEKLISCLTDLANNLNLLHSEVEKS